MFVKNEPRFDFLNFFPNFRFSGALCGLVYIFTLPCVLHVTSLRKQNEGRWPVAATITHGLLVVLGVLNLLAQFIVVD